MIEVIFLLPRNDAGEVPRFLIEVPAVPPVGAWIEDEVAGFRGFVSAISLYRAPNGQWQIHIQMKAIQ